MTQNFSYSPDFAEYITPVVNSKKFILRKVFIILGIVAAVAAGFCIVMFKPQVAFFSLIFIGIMAYLGWFLWRYTSVEYEYYIAQGEMHFDTIYNTAFRKSFFDCKIREMQKIGKLEEFKNTASLPVVSAISNKAPENSYYALIEGENGKKTVLFFEANEKIIKIMKTFNPKAFI